MRIAGGLVSWSMIVWLVASTMGCVTDEIVVATVEGGAPTDHPMMPHNDHPCDSNAECHANELCDKMHCGDAHGHCALRPLSCRPDQEQSCGCDGVTYWNDCLRRQSGVSAATPGECAQGAALCSSSDAHECPMPGASCARLLPPGAACSTDVQGACWMLPEICPIRPSLETWTSCADPMTCEDTCSAIRGGAVHQRNLMHGCIERDR